MASRYEIIENELRNNPKKWVITGAAGFIGSNLVERLLNLGQGVLGVDDYSNGKKENVDSLKECVSEKAWQNFKMVELDVASDKLKDAVAGYDIILHQGALGSVPRSIENPVKSLFANVVGTTSVFKAAADNKIKRVVYASSSSTYGDAANQEFKKEGLEGNPLSPYAASKAACELLGESCSRVYDMKIVGLKYFNVFGPRQRTDGPYAAVIPKWSEAIRSGKSVDVYGDGKQSRDFSYIENVVQANILAGLSDIEANHIVCNIALGGSTSLNDIHKLLLKAFDLPFTPPTYLPRRVGDIDSSMADISKAREYLGYEPVVNVEDGIKKYVEWVQKK